jgi:hypothetical protein
MIRIDEIYATTFWPWLEKNRPGTRLFFCDPPGTTQPANLFNLGRDDWVENDFVFFHDQEPIHLDLHEPLFQEVFVRSEDLTYPPHLNNGYTWSGVTGHVVVSEKGQYVKQLQQKYGWRPHYYFYHGWACLDWFRGYDRSFLIPRAKDRQPKQTFMCPNRIVGGRRDHRVLFLYNIFKNNLQNNHISAPRICPEESVDIVTIASRYGHIYPDIEQVFDQARLPRLFANETTQVMSSYRLTNFAEAEDSLIYVATETVYTGDRLHLTEKTFKAIALEMPFVLIAPHHSLEYLRSYGFQTFEPYIDESYDTIEDPIGRIEAAASILSEIQARSAAAKIQLHQDLLPRVEHNRNHFYSGGFADQLWAELMTMLAEFDV